MNTAIAIFALLLIVVIFKVFTMKAEQKRKAEEEKIAAEKKELEEKIEKERQIAYRKKREEEEKLLLKQPFTQTMDGTLLFRPIIVHAKSTLAKTEKRVEETDRNMALMEAGELLNKGWDSITIYGVTREKKYKAWAFFGDGKIILDEK